jgi:hypothetical protein
MELAAYQDAPDRAEYVTALLGKPWAAGAEGPDVFDCYSLARKVQRELFNTKLPDVKVPTNISMKEIIRLVEHHVKAAQDWIQIHNRGQFITARDGALAILGSTVRANHIGVWFRRERSILHCDNPDGVCFHDLPTLRALGFHRIVFLENIKTS